jgi:hypothetical protein
VLDRVGFAPSQRSLTQYVQYHLRLPRRCSFCVSGYSQNFTSHHPCPFHSSSSALQHRPPRPSSPHLFHSPKSNPANCLPLATERALLRLPVPTNHTPVSEHVHSTENSPFQDKNALTSSPCVTTSASQPLPNLPLNLFSLPASSSSTFASFCDEGFHRGLFLVSFVER